MSKWDKLIEKILNLSKDMRFDELRKVLESYGYVLNAQEVEVVITLSESRDVNRLRYQNMNLLKKYMWKW